MIRYPCLKRCGPIETFEDYTGPRRSLSLSMSEKTWPNWNGSIALIASGAWTIHVWRDVAQLKLKAWSIKVERVRRPIHVWKDVAQLKHNTYWHTTRVATLLSMSAKTWPNWNSFGRVMGVMTSLSIHVWKDVAQLKLVVVSIIVPHKRLYPSEETWPNWNWARPCARIGRWDYPCLKICRSRFFS